MEPEQYAVMARREQRHWWYAGMRRVALSLLDHALADRLAEHAGRDRLGEAAGRERVGQDASRDRVGQDASRERLGEAAGRERVGHDAGRDRLGEDAGRDRLGQDARKRLGQHGDRDRPGYNGGRDRLGEHAGGNRRPLRLLDAGCGTGGTTVELRRYGEVVGLDLAWQALRPAAALGQGCLAGRLVRGNVEGLPFGAATFDVVTSFEVVYHLGVASDQAALAELRRVLRPDGLLLLRVPAHDWLRGAHDRLVHTRHRYSRAEVASKLARAGFTVERLTWANSLLFPPAVAKRLLERRAPRVDSAAEPDLWQPPGPLNALLENLVAVEGLALPRGIDLPFGLSLLALARPA